MHEIVTGDERWQELDAREEQLAEAERAYHDRAKRDRDAYEQRLAEWRREAREAVLRGDEPPAEPPEPEPLPPATRDDPTAAARAFKAQWDALREERRSLLRSMRADVERAAADHEHALYEQARTHVAALQTIADEVGGMLQALTEVRRLDPNEVHTSRRPNAATLAAAVQQQHSLVAPVTQTPASDVQADAEPVTFEDGGTVRGLNPPGAFGRPPATSQPTRSAHI